MHMPNKAKRLAAALAAAALAGCVIQRPVPVEMKVDSVPLSSPAGSASEPFCLHLRFDTRRYYLAYSENAVEAWVTGGSCSSNGARRGVESINLGWRYKWEGLSGKQCTQQDSCALGEKNVVLGKVFECAMVTARDGEQSAHLSTDQVGCP